MAVADWKPPAPPDHPVQEGGRWRWHRPTSADVAAWFASQPLDEGMDHAHYVGGIVLIGQSEKVRYTRPDGGSAERYETVYAPYVQIGTRDGYFHRLAEVRGLIPVIEAADVPRSVNPKSPYFNGHMPKGLWWHVVLGEGGEALRYLCATARVALYEPQSYAALLAGRSPLPVRAGEGTKQVGGGPDPNGIAKAQTGAIGRALGVAGILVIGTGVATADDMQELPGYGASAPGPEQAQLPSEIATGEPPSVDPTVELDALRSRALAVSTQMQESAPEAWREFSAWYDERRKSEDWSVLADVPFESLKSIVSRMERMLAEAS